MGIIKVIPSGIAATQVATSDINSEVIVTETMGMKVGALGVHAVCAGFNGADATLKIQHSNDSSNWGDVPDSSVTLANGSNFLTPVTQLAMGYYRVVYTKNANSAGTIVVNVNLR